MSLSFEQSISLLFSHLVVSKSLQPPGLQHTRLPCPSPSPRVCSNSCPVSQWCHPAFSSFVAPFSFCLQPFPASRSFQMNRLFTSGGQSVGTSASASVLPMNIQVWFPLGLTSLISLQPKSLESSSAPQFEGINSLVPSLLYGSTLTSLHDYWKNLHLCGKREETASKPNNWSEKRITAR